MTRRRFSSRALSNGRSKGIPFWAFDSEQLQTGIRVEREHTTDPAIAARIAADHLTEDPAYYRKLRKLNLGETCAPSSRIERGGVGALLGGLLGGAVGGGIASTMLSSQSTPSSTVSTLKTGGLVTLGVATLGAVIGAVYAAREPEC